MINMSPATPTASADTWTRDFSRLFHAGVAQYRAGHVKAAGLLDAEGEKFLESIGHSAQEFFDFIEDFARGGEPTLETALRIAEVRRDYFLKEQGGRRPRGAIAMADLPPKDAEIEGVAWLPRLLAKAEAKLRGEMPPELMYGCGGDRRFFAAHQVDAAEFLRKVWSAQGNAKEVIAWVKAQSRR
jgi:hypothetical protein